MQSNYLVESKEVSSADIAIYVYFSFKTGKGYSLVTGKRLLSSQVFYYCVRLSSVYKSKKEGKDQETIQSSSTPDPGYHMGN